MINETKASLAHIGEIIAMRYLVKLGLTILDKNYHSAYGELDIIAQEKNEIIFAEVKTRTSHSLQAAENSISLSKQKKITLTAMHYISKHPQLSNLSSRFDVLIVFHYPKDDTYKVIHYKNAFDPAIPGISN